MSKERDLKTIIQHLKDGWTAVGKMRRDANQESWWAVEHRQGVYVFEDCYARHEDDLTRVRDDREWREEPAFVVWLQSHLGELSTLRPPSYEPTVDTIQFEQLVRPQKTSGAPRPVRGPLTYVPSQQIDALLRPARAVPRPARPLPGPAGALPIPALVRPGPPPQQPPARAASSLMPLGLDPDRQPDAASRAESIRAFAAACGPDEALILILALGDPGAHVRQAASEALSALGERHPELALEALSDTGGDPSKLGVCHDPRAAWALAALWRGAREARPEIDRPEGLRRQALDALIALGTASTAEPLMAILEDPASDIADTARRALLRLPAKPSAQL